MKKILALLPLLALAACSNELRVFTDFDRDVEIHRLTTYGWLDTKGIESRNNPVLLNELTDKRVKEAVERQINLKGYKPSPAFAEIILHYHIVVENKVSIRTEPYGYNYGRYWLNNEVDTYRYNEGTLIIDFMDSRNCNLLWRGWAVSVIDQQDRISEELINAAVEQIFQKFPMCANKEAQQP